VGRVLQAGGPFLSPPNDGLEVDDYENTGILQLDELGLEFVPASLEEVENHALHGPLDICEMSFTHSSVERDALMSRTALGSGISGWTTSVESDENRQELFTGSGSGQGY
jgi:hypothetical protein